MDVPLELPSASTLVLSDDESGHWITVNGTHVFIDDSKGSQKDQVDAFLKKKGEDRTDEKVVGWVGGAKKPPPKDEDHPPKDEKANPKRPEDGKGNESPKSSPDQHASPAHGAAPSHAKHEGGHKGGGGSRGYGGGGMRSGGGGGSGQRKSSKRKIMMPAKHLGLSLMDSADNFLFVPGCGDNAIACGDQTTADGKPIRRFRKEIIREGDFQKAADNLAFTVTRDSLNHWVDTFGQMTQNGVDVYFPAGHTNRPEANRGYWRKLEVAPSTRDPEKLALWGEVDAIGEDGIGLIGRTQVSLYSPRMLEDGEGHKYHRPIVHIAACTDPVIPGLSDWQPVAASLAAGDPEAGIPAATVMIPFAPTADDTGMVKMIADGLQPEEGKGVIDECDLWDFMRGLRQGERVAGLRYGPEPEAGMPDTRKYEGVIRKIRVTNSMDKPDAHPADAPRVIVVVQYDDGDGDVHDVLSCEPHIMFVRYRAEVDAGQSKPTSLSLDGKPACGQDEKEDKGASKEEADDAEFVAKAQARARGEEVDGDDKGTSLSHAWQEGTVMAAEQPAAVETPEVVPAAEAATSVVVPDVPAVELSACEAGKKEGEEDEPKKPEETAAETALSHEPSAVTSGGEVVPTPAEALPPPKAMNVAVILNRLGISDLSMVTAENAESMILSGIDAFESKIISEADAALQLSSEELRLANSPREISDIEVNLKHENLDLRLSNLVEAGRLTPAAKAEFLKLCGPSELSLSLSRGDDTLDKVLKIIALNEPVHLKEVTAAQARGAVELSREGDPNANNPLLADAERRRQEWENQQRAAAACR